MEELKRNDRITFTEKDWKIIEDELKAIDAMKLGLESLSESLYRKQKLVWETILAITPELEGYKSVLQRSEKQVMVLRKDEPKNPG